MKRIRMWLRELSLSQQLLSMIFLFIMIFAMFVIIFLSPSIERFTEAEMYNRLHSAQESLILYADQNPGQSLDFVQTDGAISAYLFDHEKNTFTVIYGSKMDQTLKERLKTNANVPYSGTLDSFYTPEDQLDGTNTPVDNTVLYSKTLLNDGRELITVMSNAAQQRLRDSLINGVVLLNVSFVIGFMVMLLIWVTTLILPLSQIKYYIAKIKNEEDAELVVKRNDEIGEVADALRDMNSQLKKQNREKEEMIQNISHDLKTPIATIKSYGESIKDGIYPYETLEKSVDVIIEHANRLEKKVKSLIILNKMDYLKDTVEEGNHLNMNKIIDKALLSLKVVRPEISFICELNEEVYFHGEEEPWRIVVENLIDNALRYSKSYIKVTLQDDELCVINDGKNISKDRLSTLFHRYEKGTDGQFGLGLSIVHRVVTTYGYRVAAENLTEGVCFRIWHDTKTQKPKKTNENTPA